LPAPALGLSDPHPVGGPITGAPEAGAADEGFQQLDGMAVLALPIGGLGTRTQGRMRKRVLLTTLGNAAARWRGGQPIQRSRGAHCQAAAPKTTQASGRPVLDATQYWRFSPTRDW